MMEEEYYADRLKLRHLLRADPARSSQALAAETGRSVSWVRKWVKRLRAAGDEDQAVLRGLSRIARRSKKRVPESVIERVLEIRDAPPEPFPRVPGPIPILYYLHQDEDLKAQGVYLPSSTRTIWQILKANGGSVAKSRRQTKYRREASGLCYRETQGRGLNCR